MIGMLLFFCYHSIWDSGGRGGGGGNGGGGGGMHDSSFGLPDYLRWRMFFKSNHFIPESEGSV